MANIGHLMGDNIARIENDKQFGPKATKFMDKMGIGLD